MVRLQEVAGLELAWETNAGFNSKMVRLQAACILVEVFCNTTGIFRGLAVLKSSRFENYQTGSFIDSLSTLVNLPQRTCAVGIAAIFAGLVAGVFVVCLIETRK